MTTYKYAGLEMGIENVMKSIKIYTVPQRVMDEGD